MGLKMFRFTASLRTLGTAVALHSPLHFDANLVPHLIAEHRELNARFAALVSRFGADPDVVEKAVRDCAARFVELRRVESTRLYPVVARAIQSDDEALRQFGQLRLVMLGTARRALRLFEELAEAIRIERDANAAADRVAEALAEYWQRNQAQIYPLYELLAVSQRREAAMGAG